MEKMAQNGMEKMARTKWDGKDGTDKMGWKIWHGQSGMNEMAQISILII